MASGFRLQASGHDLQPAACSLQPKTAQSTLEYAVFTAVVAAALVAMQVYLRRAIQANLKSVENQINAEAVR